MKARFPTRTEILQVNAKLERLAQACHNEATAEEIRRTKIGQKILRKRRANPNDPLNKR